MRSRLGWRVMALGVLCTVLLATAGLGQEDDDEPIQMMPNPEEHVGRTSDVLALSRISTQVRTMNGRSYLPVADLARALGSPTPPRPGDPGDPIHLQAGHGGILELAATSRGAASVRSPAIADDTNEMKADGSVHEHKVQKVSPQSTSEHKWRGQPSTALARGAKTSVPPSSLYVGASLVSRGIIIVNGMPMAPVDDLAAALGAKIVPHGGGLAFEKIPGRNGALSF